MQSQPTSLRSNRSRAAAPQCQSDVDTASITSSPGARRGRKGVSAVHTLAALSEEDIPAPRTTRSRRA